MVTYTIVVALLSVIAGLLIAVCTKKSEGIKYSKLDKAGIATNIILALAYTCISPFYLFIGILSNPTYDGFLGFLGYAVAVLISSAAIFCYLGLGFSVALRKKGKSKLSFAVQFAGVAGIALTLALFFLCTGPDRLLRNLN